MRLRTAEGVLIPALFAYTADEFGDELLDEAWEEFFLWDAVPDDIDNSREFGTTFDPFFAFSFVPDATETDCRQVGRLSRSPCTSYIRRSSPAPTSTGSSLSRRARATRVSSSSNRPILAD